MLRLMGLSLTSSAFFSFLFLSNKVMDLEHGHWVWTASLRYLYWVFFLAILVLFRSGSKALTSVISVFVNYLGFWLIVGTIMFGGYSLICFAASYAPSWVIAAVFQLNIVATPPTLRAFGKEVPRRAFWISSVIFIGTLLVNLEQASLVEAKLLLLGVLSTAISALSVPAFYQLVYEAKHGTHSRIPHIAHPIMNDTPARLLLMVLGTLPLVIALPLFFAPPPPVKGQFIYAALNAFLTGVVAVNIYASIRHSKIETYEIAAIDAVGGMVPVFTLIGEILFLQGSSPNTSGFLGLALIAGGNGLYAIGGKPKD